MVVIGSDHTGIELKNNIIKYLEKEKIEYIDAIKENDSNDDYPDIAIAICNKVLEDARNLGIAICGTGIGISIACNKIKNIRAAMCTDEYMAEMSRKHNNANVLCLGSRLKNSKDITKIQSIVQAYLDNFYEAGRHERRLLKIVDIENSNMKEGN